MPLCHNTSMAQLYGPPHNGTDCSSDGRTITEAEAWIVVGVLMVVAGAVVFFCTGLCRRQPPSPYTRIQ